MDWKSVWRNYGLKFPKPKDRNRYVGTVSKKDPKQDEPQQTFMKTYYN